MTERSSAHLVRSGRILSKPSMSQQSKEAFMTEQIQANLVPAYLIGAVQRQAMHSKEAIN